MDNIINLRNNTDSHVREDVLYGPSNTQFEIGYEACEKEMIEKIEYWFHNIGPFVFPEDDDTLKSLLDYIKR